MRSAIYVDDVEMWAGDLPLVAVPTADVGPPTIGDGLTQKMFTPDFSIILYGVRYIVKEVAIHIRPGSEDAEQEILLEESHA